MVFSPTEFAEALLTDDVPAMEAILQNITDKDKPAFINAFKKEMFHVIESFEYRSAALEKILTTFPGLTNIPLDDGLNGVLMSVMRPNPSTLYTFLRAGGNPGSGTKDDNIYTFLTRHRAADSSVIRDSFIALRESGIDLDAPFPRRKSPLLVSILRDRDLEYPHAFISALEAGAQLFPALGLDTPPDISVYYRTIKQAMKKEWRRSPEELDYLMKDVEKFAAPLLMDVETRTFSYDMFFDENQKLKPEIYSFHALSLLPSIFQKEMDRWKGGAAEMKKTLDALSGVWPDLEYPPAMMREHPLEDEGSVTVKYMRGDAGKKPTLQ